MNRTQLITVALALIAMLLGVALYDMLQKRLLTGPADTKKPPPEIHSIPLTDLEKRESVVSDWKSEILVVNFWAPWCAPCRREIPSLIEIQKSYQSRGVQILGIAFDNESQVKRFAEEYDINYPLFLAIGRAAMYNTAFGNPSGSLPFTVLLDRNQQIIFKHNGELSLEQLRSELDKSL